MPRPCSKCYKNLDFISVPGRRGLTAVDAVPALVMVDEGAAWVGWSTKTMAAVKGWIMDRSKPEAETKAFAASKGKSLVWAWRPHFLTCPFANHKSAPAQQQSPQPQPAKKEKKLEPADVQGRLF